MDEQDEEKDALDEEFGRDPVVSKKGKGNGEILLPEDDGVASGEDEPLLDDEVLSADSLAEEEEELLPEDLFDDKDLW